MQQKLHHFLRLADLDPSELNKILHNAIEVKKHRRSFEERRGKSLALIFTKQSTRTRLSFEVAMGQLGGQCIFMSSKDTQLSRSESWKDTAKVVSSMVEGVVIRCHSHRDIEDFAAHATCPVVNGLTEVFHPCQLLADVMTFYETKGDINGRTVAWIGGGNNMCQSYMEAASLLGFRLHIACPLRCLPDSDVVFCRPGRLVKGSIQMFDNPFDAVRGADLVTTDVWCSMGATTLSSDEMKAFMIYQVNDALMQHAHKDAIFMHCLPAHRGEEVSASVIDGPQSLVWRQAENRLHAQKSLLDWIL